MFLAEGAIEAAEGQEPTLKVSDLKSLDDVRIAKARVLNITIPARDADERYMESLFHILERERGLTAVNLNNSGAVRQQSSWRPKR